MQRYKKLSGDSGVDAYRIEEQAIELRFEDGSVYLYNYGSSGKKNIEAMKVLARSGKGLSTFINQHVRDKFAAKR